MLLPCKTTVIVTLTFAELPKKFSEFYRSRHFVTIIDVTDILDNSSCLRRPNAQRSGEWICLHLQTVELNVAVPWSSSPANAVRFLVWDFGQCPGYRLQILQFAIVQILSWWIYDRTVRTALLDPCWSERIQSASFKLFPFRTCTEFYA